MAKLAKGLTLAAGGVPAAAIITACVINANPNAHAATGTVHTENVAAETDSPKPAHTAPHAAVKARPSHDGTDAEPRKDTGAGHPKAPADTGFGRPTPGVSVSGGSVSGGSVSGGSVPEQPVSDPQGLTAAAPVLANPAAGFGQPVPEQSPAVQPVPALQAGPGTDAPRQSLTTTAAGTATVPDTPASAATRSTGQTIAPAHRSRPPEHGTPARTAPQHQAVQHQAVQRPAVHHETLATRPGGRADAAESRTARSPERNRPASTPSHRTTPDAAGATGTATKSAYVPTEEDVKKRLGRKVVAFARAQLGKPYVFGAEGPRAYDCSGLVQAAYKAAGIRVPRTSDAQYWYGKRVHAGRERPGDLVFFDYRPGHTGPGHVGIVLDPAKGLMIVAPHTGDHVKIQSYKRYPGGPVGFTRPLDRKDMSVLRSRVR